MRGGETDGRRGKDREERIGRREEDGKVKGNGEKERIRRKGKRRERKD